MDLMDDEIISLKPSGYILCNGAYACVDDKDIYSVYFRQEEVDKIREVVNKYDGFAIFETLNETYVDSLESRPFLEFMNCWGKALTGFREGRDPDDRYLIAMIGFSDRNVMPHVERELKDYADLAAHMQYSSCDVNIRGINKGYGVKKIIEYLNVPLEDTYAFGDGINDLEMLQSVGHPIIMANCNDELRPFGFEETADVLDDGFYKYLTENGLIKAI